MKEKRTLQNVAYILFFLAAIIILFHWYTTAPLPLLLHQHRSRYRMVLDTGIHPGELKYMVCSPGGTTIQAVKVLEEKGLRAAVMSAMEVCRKASEPQKRNMY